MQAFLKLLYSLLIAGAVVGFVASGIWAFYPGPKAPEYPTPSYIQNENTIEQTKFEREQREYEEKLNKYQDEQKAYSGRITPVIAAIAVVFFAAGLYLMNTKNELIGEGIALGGLFTTFYGMGHAGSAESRQWMFINVCILLAGAILLGHRKFMAEPAPKSRKK